MSTASVLNRNKYSVLLSRLMPVAIEPESEYRRMLAAAEQLIDKGDDLAAEEGRLLKLLAVLIQDYEQRNYPLPKAPPHEMVKYLLEEKGLKPKHLWGVIGSKGRVSEILSGKRSPSKTQARKLADFFDVSVELFM